MADQFIVRSWVLREAIKGYEVYGTGLEKAVCKQDGGPVPDREGREEVKRAQWSAEELGSLVPEDEHAPAFLPGGGEEFLWQIRLMAKIAVAWKRRKIDRATAAVKTQLAGELGNEERIERREALAKLERQRQDLERNMDHIGEPCAELKFGLTIDQVLDYYQGTEPDDIDKWIL
jgi:hypothetical protein